MTEAVENNLHEKPLLLVVDDDQLICDTMGFSMSPAFEVLSSHSRPHCLQLIRQLRHAPEIALIDLGLPPLPHRPDEGLALISELLQASPETRIVVLSGQSDEGNARHARALGAVDFVAKPCTPSDLHRILQKALSFRPYDNDKAQAKPFPALIGASPAIQKLKTQLQQYADSPFPVLIEGESGSGKEIVANSFVRQDSKRRNQPFFALNCAAISANLVEPTLFGYAKGAFTGAISSRAGYFDEASEGTLFLDEIGELPLELQAKLLRVLENGEYQRVGETQKRISHARIIAATNRDLRQEVKNGRFRADLYHRLSVFSITVPPLREMENDKFLLLDHFRRHYATLSNQPPFTLSPEAEMVWTRYGFPGNVRELRNIVIRLTAKHSGQTIGAGDLEDELDLQDEPPLCSLQPQQPNDNETMIEAASKRLQQPLPFSLDRLLAETEQSYIESALRLAHGNVSQAARLLGINRTTLYNRMETLAKAPYVS